MVIRSQSLIEFGWKSNGLSSICPNCALDPLGYLITIIPVYSLEDLSDNGSLFSHVFSSVILVFN